MIEFFWNHPQDYFAIASCFGLASLFVAILKGVTRDHNVYENITMPLLIGILWPITLPTVLIITAFKD